MLLPAYELGILNEKDDAAFETHLMECDYCRNSLSELLPYSGMLRHDEAIRNTLAAETEAVINNTYQDRPANARSRKIIFLSAVIFSFIAIVAVVCVLLLLPKNEKIKMVQHLSLTPARSAEIPSIQASLGSDAVLSFYLPEAADSDKPYYLAIVDNQHDTIMTVNDYRLGRPPIGYILFPNSKMKPGQYELIISGSGDFKSAALRKFAFYILK